MIIEGFLKTSLLDFPGNLSSTVFTKGCNFNCPFCHNPSLMKINSDATYALEDILSHLKKRENLLDGICITGGEATLHRGLIPFLRKVREFDLKIKLDTNGYTPEILKEILQENLVDYVAMDIKNSPKKYAMTCGMDDLNYEIIKESIDSIIASGIEHEFRTTIMKEFHSEEDFRAITDEIKGCKYYYLQQYQYRPSQAKRFTPFDEEEVKKIKSTLENTLNFVGVRGL